MESAWVLRSLQQHLFGDDLTLPYNATCCDGANTKENKKDSQIITFATMNYCDYYRLMWICDIDKIFMWTFDGVGRVALLVIPIVHEELDQF